MTIKDIREHIFDDTPLSTREKRFYSHFFFYDILIIWLLAKLMENK